MTATAPDHRATALRAYFIWEGEGRPHGRHELHWLAAEAAEIRAAEPVTIAQAVLAKKAPATKRVAAPKAAAAKKDTPAKAAAPKAPAHAVVAAATLTAPRAPRATAKGSRSAH